jgi:diamine N-acetyltransferase
VIAIERASSADVPAFVAMEQGLDTREFIMPYSREEHLEKIADPSVIYLRILKQGLLVGFFILSLDANQKSVEFRRIVVATKGAGIGQTAIALMERFCRATLGCTRIWLDVFEHNARGRHIYEKLGYRRCGQQTYGNSLLLLYEKWL